MPLINYKHFDNKLQNMKRVLDISEPLQEACLLVEETAKEKCPVMDGTLRNSITHQVVGDVGYVGTNVSYAPYVEYGTGIYAVNGDGRDTPWVYYSDKGYTAEGGGIAHFVWTEGQKPQPFLQPALDTNKEMITKIFGIFFERELGK